MVLSRLRDFVEHSLFEWFIAGVILLNAVLLGLESFRFSSPALRGIIAAGDMICLVIFVVEIALKIIVYGLKFPRDPWRVFDFLVVGIALLPATGTLSVLRALRILRTLRMISVVPRLRRVVQGLIEALPGLGAVCTILILIFYVGAVIATNLFGEDFPDWFGDIWKSAYSLFQIMTLESWSMGIVRPVLEKHSYAWIFFIPFILVATFTMLNLFIAVIVGAMQEETQELAQERAEQGHDERVQLLAELQALRSEVRLLTERIGSGGGRSAGSARTKASPKEPPKKKAPQKKTPKQ